MYTFTAIVPNFLNAEAHNERCCEISVLLKKLASWQNPQKRLHMFVQYLKQFMFINRSVSYVHEKKKKLCIPNILYLLIVTFSGFRQVFQPAG